MNVFFILMAVNLLLCFGTAGILFHKRHIAEILTLGVCWYFCSYVFSTMLLFLLNVYTLNRGFAATCCTDGIIFLTAVLTSEKVPLHKLKEGFQSERELKVFVIPLLIAVIGLPFISQKNELFGMGQDEGVYQCEAINFMNGYNIRQQDFEEYHFLESDEAKENFETTVHNKLVGYDIPDEEYPDTVYDREVSPVSGIYHGIPTYPAILAMWGEIFGIAHMAEVQTVFYILMLFLTGFVCDNLHLKPLSKLIACMTAALSPVVIWVAKSSLTEMFLAVLLLLFLYFLTDSEYPEYYGYSIMPIIVFSCYHVSIYTLIPYVLMIYAGMYFFTKRKIFAGMLLFSVLEYLLSYLMMRHVQPFYTMNNYRFVFGHGITVYNITQVVLIISGILILFCMIYILLVWKFKKTETLKVFLENQQNTVLMQWLFICLTALPLIYIFYQSFVKLDTIEHITALTISGFALNAGLLLLPVGVAVVFIRPKAFLESEAKLIIFVSCFYCVLIYAAFLRFEIEFYYYYARYLVPFIPCAVLFAVTALDKSDKKILLTVSAVSIGCFLPYSSFLMQHKDDTRMEWSVLEDLTEQIPQNSCVVMETDTLPMLWLPVRAVTKANVYPAENDFTAQCKTLSERYEKIYCISQNQISENFELLYKNQVHCSEDMNFGELSSMPLHFSETTDNIYLYEYLNYQEIYTVEEIQKLKLYGIDKPDGDFCWTVNPTSAMRCTLKQKNYTLHLKLGSKIPVAATGKDSFKIQLSVNGIQVTAKTLTSKNITQELNFYIPASYLNDGLNLISFRTDMWNASAINPKDNRTLGIPIQSVTFQERS